MKVKSCEKEKVDDKKQVSYRARNQKKSIDSERLEIKKVDSIGSHLSKDKSGMLLNTQAALLHTKINDRKLKGKNCFKLSANHSL